MAKLNNAMGLMMAMVVTVNDRPVTQYQANALRGGPATVASFDLTGTATVNVAGVKSMKVLPAGIEAVGGKFTLNEPAQLTLETDAGVLHLFANPPDRPDTNSIYFGPGVHEVTTLSVRSGQTIHLAEGAILKAKLAADEKPVREKNWRGNKVYMPLLAGQRLTNVTIRGRGVIDLSGLPWHARTAMWFEECEDVLVEGITIVDAPAWGVAFHKCRRVTVRNVKQICPRENSDGVDLCNTQDALVEDCFFRNNDDAVCVKTLSPGMESKNILVQRCVVWNERARGLGITSETRADISHVVFRDCDIIHDYSAGYDCAALAVLVSDAGTMRDIRFENIRCHDVHDTLINCWIGADMWGKDTTRGRIQGVVFKDITVTGTNRPLVKLTGFDAQHRVEDVTFERVGPIRSVQTNAHVNSVRFIGEQTK